MKQQQAVGWTLILIGVGMALMNTADLITDLRDWHGAAQPAFVGPVLKQLGSVLVAALGGKLLPTADRP